MREWELRVSQREIHRMHVVRLTMEGRETVGGGAKVLGISPRQMKRLRRKMKERGVEGLMHGNRGKRAWNKDGVRESGEGNQIGARAVPGFKRYALGREAQREGEDKVIAAYGAQDIASGRYCDCTHAWGKASLQKTRAQGARGSTVVVGW